MVGQQLGNYRIVAPLASGGMGAVYIAEHERFGGRFAIKILCPAGVPAICAAERAMQEARAASRIQHPGVVKVFDCGHTPAGEPYLVMELIDGEPLSARLQRGGALPILEALRLARQIATVLAAAHTCGVVHRDLKPANVMLATDPEVCSAVRIKLLDFGIAAIHEEQNQAQNKLTGTHVVFGTPAYMAPEQCRSARLSVDRSDVYALGIVLFELLTGRPPFPAGSLAEQFGQHLFAEPEPLSQALPGCPGALVALVHRMLAKDPKARPSAAAVVAAIDRLATEKTTPSARRWAVLLVAGAVLGIGVLGSFRLRDPVEIRPPAPPQDQVRATAPSVPPRAPTPPRRSEPTAPNRSPDRRNGRERTIPRALGAVTPPAPSREAPEPSRTSPSELPSGLRPFDAVTPTALPFAVLPEPPPRANDPQIKIEEAEHLRSLNQPRHAVSLALEARGTLRPRAWLVAGLAACEAGDTLTVRQAFQTLAPEPRRCLLDVCVRNGVRRIGTQFVRGPARTADSGMLARVRQAERAYIEEDYAQALRLAKEVAHKSSAPAAWLTVGRAACMQHDGGLASAAVCRLDDGRARNVREVCSRQGVQLD